MRNYIIINFFKKIFRLKSDRRDLMKSKKTVESSIKFIKSKEIEARLSRNFIVDKTLKIENIFIDEELIKKIGRN